MPEDDYIKGWVLQHPPKEGEEWSRDHINAVIENGFPKVDETRRERLTSEILEDLKKGTRQ